MRSAGRSMPTPDLGARICVRGLLYMHGCQGQRHGWQTYRSFAAAGQRTSTLFAGFAVCSPYRWLWTFKRRLDTLMGYGVKAMVANWGMLHRGCNCSPQRAMDGRIMRRGITGSCQSAATSKIAKRCSCWLLVCTVSIEVSL